MSEAERRSPPTTNGAGMGAIPTISTISPLEAGILRPSEEVVVKREEEEEDEEGVSARFESLEYTPMENELSVEESKTPTFQRQIIRDAVNRWIVCAVIGVLTALVACFIDFAVERTTELKFRVIRELYQGCKDGGVCLVEPLAAWWAFNVGFVALASVLVVWFAGPVAAGSGIPQIKCFLNGVMIPGVVRLKTLVAKAVGVACSVAGGLSVGKEGPMIHSGAVVAAGISQGRCITFPFDLRIFQSFRSDREKRDFVSAGAAAGVAAAFGAPIGGVLFALEEGASFWDQSLTWRIFFSSMVSSFTLSAVISTMHGKPGDFSWQGLANFGTFAKMSYNWWEIVFFLIIGGLGGLSGALFNHINLKLTLFRSRHLSASWKKFVEALLVAAMSGTGAFLMIYVIADCHPLSINRNMTSSPLQLWCPDGQYSAVAEIFFQSPEAAVKSLFHGPSGSFSNSTLAVFAILYFLLSTWTYGLSVPSGLFIPTLLTGAAWGRLIGSGVEAAFPDAHIDPGKYALAGAAAQLGGVVRMTISLCAIIIEATRNITFGLPIMLILMVAKWVGDYFNEGLYDIHIELGHVPLLPWDPPKMANTVPARAVMREGVRTLREVERVGSVFDLLSSNRHHAFPIVDEAGRLKGLIMRSQLIVLLQYRQYSRDRDGSEWVDGYRRIGTQEFRDDYPKYNVVMENIKISPEDRRCWLQLGRTGWMAPYRVPEKASLQQIFALFRGLGLRALPVVDEDNRLLGIITRKDIARFKDHWSSDSGYKVLQLPILY